MKYTLLSLSLLLFATPAYSQATSTEYDAERAERLEADDYGMKSYVLIILKTGSSTSATPDEVAVLFQGHMQNMVRLAEDGALLLAGPLGANDETYRGIFILNTSDFDQAREWVNTDPAIAAGLLEAMLYSYYGSAALQELNALHATIQRVEF